MKRSVQFVLAALLAGGPAAADEPGSIREPRKLEKESEVKKTREQVEQERQGEVPGLARFEARRPARIEKFERKHEEERAHMLGLEIPGKRPDDAGWGHGKGGGNVGGKGGDGE